MKNSSSLTVAVFGMGYIGTTCAAYFANNGHRVIGVEIDGPKRELLERGVVPFYEPGLERQLLSAVQTGSLEVTDSAQYAVGEADVSLICVGTPTTADGVVIVRNLEAVAADIGEALSTKTGYHVVAVRSTSPVGTVSNLTQIIGDVSGRTPEKDFSVVCNPEFLREGSALEDIERPPFTVVGGSDGRALDVMRRLYACVDAPFYVMEPQGSELLKYACNAFHALKVVFANEVNEIAGQFGVDGRDVMEVFCRDEHLNISPRYLRPGFAYGGSCLPKDVRAFNALARRAGVNVPVIENIGRSNELQITRLAQRVLALDAGNICFLGITFKEDTDDIRESPYLKMVNQVTAGGRCVRVHEPEIDRTKLFGANLDYLEQLLPNWREVMCDNVHEVIADLSVVVVSRNDPRFNSLLKGLTAEQWLVDLAGIPAEDRGQARYIGLYADSPLRG